MSFDSDIETHLEKGLDINLPDINGNTFLHKAILENNPRQ